MIADHHVPQILRDRGIAIGLETLLTYRVNVHLGTGVNKPAEIKQHRLSEAKMVSE